MIKMNKVGTMQALATTQTVFTARKINSIGVREGADVNIEYTECSELGEVNKNVTIPFDKFSSNLEPVINDLIDGSSTGEEDKNIN